MRALYTIADIREIERTAKTASKQDSLMQRAGDSAAILSLRLISIPLDQARLLVLAGPGDNGGDALVAASRLAQNGICVTTLLYADPNKQSADAVQALRQAQAAGVQFADTACLAETLALIASTKWALVIDGLFGIGLKRAIAGDLESVVQAVNSLRGPLLALDVPSGLDADTGNIIGEQGIAVYASHTLTFIGDKPGLHTCHGRDYTGKIAVDLLGIDVQAYRPAQLLLNDPGLFSHSLKPRRHASHKGSYGDVAVIGGAAGMAGAPILSARAALYCGAGRVYVACLDESAGYDAAQPELMYRQARTFDFSAKTLVAGPGLGQSRAAVDVLARALHTPTPLVLDADALNLLAMEPGLQPVVSQRKSATIMTPHPLEAARLLGMSSAQVQADRLAAARALASRFKATIVLKGSGTVIANARQKIIINPTGNPGLASAGSGDVLAGICAALLAQGCPEWEAALAAVWMHGSAADLLVEQNVGPIGMTAGELIPVVRQVLNRLTAKYN